MDMKPMEYHRPWSYLSKNLSSLKRDEGVKKIHLSKGKHTSFVSGTFFEENITLEFW